MKRRRRKIRTLGSTSCRPVEGGLAVRCATEGKSTFCVGDRVARRDVKVKAGFKGTVVGFTKEGKTTSVRVCSDRDDPGDRAYPYHFAELKKV